jgi:putative polyhydroxyalkanoate system protein
MSNVHICRKHQLPEQECRAVAEELLGKLVDKYGGDVNPDGDNFRYRHSTGMSAVVEPRQGELDITVKLNFLTRAFAPQIKSEISKVLDDHNI